MFGHRESVFTRQCKNINGIFSKWSGRENKARYIDTFVTRYEKTDHFDKLTKFAFLIPCDAEFSVELKNVKMNA